MKVPGFPRVPLAGAAIPGRRLAGAAVAALALLLTTFTPPATTEDAQATLSAGAEHRTIAALPDLDTDIELERSAFGTYEPPSIPDLPVTGTDPFDLVPFEPPATAPIPESVPTLAPDLRVQASEGQPLDVDGLAASLEDALHVAAVIALAAEGSSESGESRELTLLAVDATSFRPLTPEVTADTPAVWERLVAGDVLVAHELAEELGLELGGTLTLRTTAGTVPVRIGAFAASGSPSLADVLVPFEVATLLGAADVNALIIAAGDEYERLASQLEELVDGEVELLRRPTPATSQPQPQPQRQAEGSTSLEAFSYTSRPDGQITIHGDWVARNIVSVTIPGMGTTRCHRVMVPQLQAAIQELIARDLYSHLRADQFAGCFVARHIDWNPAKPISMHAWGLAIDFNARDNPLGRTPVMDPRVVEVFERWGFRWGGRWNRPDGMHFEVARIVHPN